METISSSTASASNPLAGEDAIKSTVVSTTGMTKMLPKIIAVPTVSVDITDPSSLAMDTNRGNHESPSSDDDDTESVSSFRSSTSAPGANEVSDPAGLAALQYRLRADARSQIQLVGNGSSMMLLPGTLSGVLEAATGLDEGAVEAGECSATAGHARTTSTADSTKAQHGMNTDSSASMVSSTASGHSGVPGHVRFLSSGMGMPGGLVNKPAGPVPVLHLPKSAVGTRMPVSNGTARGTLRSYPHFHNPSDVPASPVSDVSGTGWEDELAGLAKGPMAPGGAVTEEPSATEVVMCPTRCESVIKLTPRSAVPVTLESLAPVEPSPLLPDTGRTADPSPGLASMPSTDPEDPSTGRRPSVFQVFTAVMTARMRRASKVAPMPMPTADAVATEAVPAAQPEPLLDPVMPHPDSARDGKGYTVTRPKPRRKSILDLFKPKEGGGKAGPGVNKSRRASAPVAKHAPMEKKAGPNRARAGSMPEGVATSKRSHPSRWASVAEGHSDKHLGQGATGSVPARTPGGRVDLSSLPRYSPKNPFAGLSSRNLNMIPSFYGPAKKNNSDKAVEQ